MSSKTASLLQIGIALIFAGVMLLASNLMDGSEDSTTITYLIIAVWFVPFSYLLNISSKNRKTRSCNS